MEHYTRTHAILLPCHLSLVNSPHLSLFFFFRFFPIARSITPAAISQVPLTRPAAFQRAPQLLMDNWRQGRYSSVSKALGRIERRTDKLVGRLNGSSGGLRHHGKISLWTGELARLQEMSDRLLDFRSRLYFYSNPDYLEGLDEWESVIEK